MAGHIPLYPCTLKYRPSIKRQNRSLTIRAQRRRMCRIQGSRALQEIWLALPCITKQQQVVSQEIILVFMSTQTFIVPRGVVVVEQVMKASSIIGLETTCLTAFILRVQRGSNNSSQHRGCRWLKTYMFREGPPVGLRATVKRSRLLETWSLIFSKYSSFSKCFTNRSNSRCKNTLH